MKPTLFFLAFLFLLCAAETSRAQVTGLNIVPYQHDFGNQKANSDGWMMEFKITYTGSKDITLEISNRGPAIVTNFAWTPPIGGTLKLGPSYVTSRILQYSLKFPSKDGYFQGPIWFEDQSNNQVYVTYRYSGTVVPGVGINDYIQMRSSPGVGPATFSPIKGSPGCPLSFCPVSYLAQFFDYDNSGSTAKSWTWKVELYHAKGTYELPVTVSPPNSKYSEMRIYAPFTLPPDYDWSRDANGNILTKVWVECIDSEGFGHPTEQIVGINYPPEKTRGTLECANGTPLANKPVTVEFWDSTRKVASQSTKTDSAGAFEVTLLGFTSNHTQERLVISSDSCKWTLPTNRYYGDLQKLVCKECGGCVKAPEFLVDWWSFDETSGAVATDVSGYANQASLSNGSTHSSGKVAGALCLDGQSSFATVKDHADINFEGDCRNDAAEAFTIDAWVKTSAAGLQVILDKREVGERFLRGYSLFIYNGRLGFQMATGPGNLFCNTPGSACANYLAPPGVNLSDGEWHFIAVTVSRCRGAVGRMYVDGNLIMTFQPLGGDISNQVPLVIGRRYPIPSVIHFDGCIDELEFFKTALSETDLDTIYNVGSFGKCKPETCKVGERRFEISAQFSVFSLNRPRPIIGHTDVGGIVGHSDAQGIIGHADNAGIGVRFTYNATRNVALEAAANFFPKISPDSFVPNGLIVGHQDAAGIVGHSDSNGFQMQFGVKLGKRFKRFGIFGKAAPGLIRFSEVNRLVGTETVIVNPALPPEIVPVFRRESKTYFSTDVGGVFEFYPSCRIFTRFDFGDTIIRYGPRTGLSPSNTLIELPPQTKHNLQFSVGVGFRF